MKDKTKKVLKTIGLVVLSLLATLGVVLGGLLIGEMGKGNNKPLLLEGERTSLRSPARFAPKLDEAENVFSDAVVSPNGDINESGIYTVESLNIVYKDDVPAGYYYVDWGYNWGNIATGLTENQQYVIHNFNGVGYWSFPTDLTNYHSYNHAFYIYHTGGMLAMTVQKADTAKVFVVDTLTVPASSRITFSESFSPLGLFSSSLTSNNGFAYIPNNVMQPYNPSLTLSGVLFRYGGIVYDYIYIELENASDWGYVDEEGLVHKGHSWGGEAGYYYAVGWVRFGRSYLGESGNDGTVVVNADLKNVDGNDGVPVFTGRTSWVNREVRTIEVIDDKGLTTGRYDSRYGEMTDLQVLDFFSLSTSSAYSVVGNVGDGNIFTLLTSAFESVLPVLNIAILPNITLGLLILLPLVAGAIVLIIRAVKK